MMSQWTKYLTILDPNQPSNQTVLNFKYTLNDIKILGVAGQWIEQPTGNHKIPSSIPTAASGRRCETHRISQIREFTDLDAEGDTRRYCTQSKQSQK